jgi:Lysozyme like domain
VALWAILLIPSHAKGSTIVAKPAVVNKPVQHYRTVAPKTAGHILANVRKRFIPCPGVKAEYGISVANNILPCGTKITLRYGKHVIPAVVAYKQKNIHDFNVSELEFLWTYVGGNPNYERTAAAIALRESSGNPNAYSTTNDRGLWQINGCWGWRSTFSVVGNARSAVYISHNGTNWGPWTTSRGLAHIYDPERVVITLSPNTAKALHLKNVGYVAYGFGWPHKVK